MQSSYPFHIMAKPTGSTCNIQCDYCYFLGREETLKEVTANSMPLETLELYIKQYIEAQPTEQVVFSWQGGEPTLLGLDYFETIIKLQKNTTHLVKPFITICKPTECCSTSRGVSFLKLIVSSSG
ncbi:hypothetical protein QYZ44_18015 [Vibrio parahaemolyticus]|nr:hypothetical protein [Vibrio parahaemolyticus]MDN4711092.1 hypothetical protein [Vibrio parahaemolyticus]